MQLINTTRTELVLCWSHDCVRTTSGYVAVRSNYGSNTLTDRGQILKRRAEHFESVLNQPAVFDDAILGEISHWNKATYLAQPTEEEVLRATRMLSSDQRQTSEDQCCLRLTHEVPMECSQHSTHD